MARMTDSFKNDEGEYMVDPDDMDIFDYVAHTLVVHETVCPEIVDNTSSVQSFESGIRVRMNVDGGTPSDLDVNPGTHE